MICYNARKTLLVSRNDISGRPGAPLQCWPWTALSAPRAQRTGDLLINCPVIILEVLFLVVPSLLLNPERWKAALCNGIVVVRMMSNVEQL